jgi:transcriptional regulator with XRE-family HTH domain
MTIGDRIRWLMEFRDIKQVALASQIGVTQAAISNLVTDSSRKPSAITLMKLAMALGCNPQWILDGKGDPFAWQAVTKDSHVELLTLFKNMPEEARQALLASARAMAPHK